MQHLHKYFIRPYAIQAYKWVHTVHQGINVYWRKGKLKSRSEPHLCFVAALNQWSWSSRWERWSPPGQIRSWRAAPPAAPGHPVPGVTTQLSHSHDKPSVCSSSVVYVQGGQRTSWRRYLPRLKSSKKTPLLTVWLPWRWDPSRPVPKGSRVSHWHHSWHAEECSPQEPDWDRHRRRGSSVSDSTFTWRWTETDGFHFLAATNRI